MGNHSWAVKNSCQENYVPPYEMEDLRAVNDWATGGAFAVFAREANVYFDKCAYNSDNPYPALFNFGRATWDSCLEMVIVGGYLSMGQTLQNKYGQYLRGEIDDGSTFRDYYMSWAVRLGFDHYITIPGDNETPIPVGAQSCR